MKPQKLLMVSAGLSLAFIARHLAEQGHELNAVDTRDHMACNCHTERDTDAGSIVHIYDTHIFHADYEGVWDYVNTHMSFIPCKNQVKATTWGHVSSLRFKLHMENQFVGKSKLPDEAQEFIETRADTSISEPQNFEGQALRFVGRGVYESFFPSYTLKQWSCVPTNLPASILKRLPLQFSYEDNYFEDTFQDMPEHGYTKMVESTLVHANITVHLNTRFNRTQKSNYHHVFLLWPAV